MTNAVYQATIEELEALLSPRVVSRSLQDGLKLLGKAPLELSYNDVEQILKSQVYRQLQVTMPVTEAKLKINDILRRLKALAAVSAPAQNQALEGQGASLAALQASLKPYNLYFEWPEVQKLRAQLQLLEREHAAGREAARLVEEARQQLGSVQRKLEDQLVEQARILGELEEALQALRASGGPRVRRLEGLLGQIGAAQRSRQLAPAEAEQARKLATDLRKLLESSPVETSRVETSPAESAREAPALSEALTLTPIPESSDLLDFDQGQHAPEVSAKLRRLDLETDGRDVEQTRKDHALVLAYAPELSEALEALEARLAGEEAVGGELAELRARLGRRESELRLTLAAELREMAEGLAALPQELERAELSYLLQVNRSVLETTLPLQHDIQHLKSLFQLAQDQRAARERQQDAERAAQTAKLAQQAQTLERSRAALGRYREAAALEREVEALAKVTARLEAARAESRFDAEAGSEARSAELRLEAAAASYAEFASERQRARLRGFLGELQGLPPGEAGAEALARRLEAHLEQLAAGPLPEESLERLQETLERHKADLRARYRKNLAQFREQAERLGAKPLLQRLAADEAALERDSYPELRDIERALAGAGAARLAEQLHDLHRLETELSSQDGELSKVVTLRSRLAEARAQLEAGGALGSLEGLWNDFRTLQGELASRSADFFPRLDRAISSFERLAKLNSEEVGTAGRILRHLSSQREAFGLVSAGMRSELERALQEAEGLVEQLEAQFEATQTVAGSLVGSNVLDGLLGFFGEGFGFGESGEKVGEDAQPPLPETPLLRHSPELDAWVDGFLSETGVAGALLLDEHGEGLSGRLDIERPSGGVIRLERDARSLGHELSLGALRCSVLETAHQALVLAVPAEGYRLLLLADPAELPGVLGRLARELHILRDLLVA